MQVLLRVYPVRLGEIIGKITREITYFGGLIKNHLSNFTYTILDELVFDGEARGCTARVDMDLVEDGAQMSLHSTRADH